MAFAEHHPPENMTAVVNSGDDFRHLSLEIWPDWDTVVYHLSGLVDQGKGWGRAGETDECLKEVARLGGPAWFYLGDRDLALHLLRTELLRADRKPSDIEGELAARLGAPYEVFRATESALATKLRTREGELWDFQEWFVRHRGEIPVREVEVCAKAKEEVNPKALSAIEKADLIVLAPSNPYLSLGPMLSCPKLLEAVTSRRESVWAVSPLLGGKAAKGPLDRLFAWMCDRGGQEAVVETLEGWASVLLLPHDELTQPLELFAQSQGLALAGAETRLGKPEHRAQFYRSLKAAWEHRR